MYTNLPEPNILRALIWNVGVIWAAGVWGYIAARLNIPAIPFVVFLLPIVCAALFPPDNFKLWSKSK